MPSVYETAVNASIVLRYANVTGDAEALEAGLAALDHMAQRRPLVPQGSPFECPAASPYLLSSAHAVNAFLAGYTATGRDDYLDEARYWARTGLPFVYLWNIPEAPVQRYATIGVFGSSYFDHANWIGRPVQWIGLLYAYALLHLADHDGSFPWQTVARGIVTSAMYQQAPGGERKGTYPDSIDGAGDLGRPGFRDPYPVWIEPDYILMNLLALDGLDPELDLRVVRDAAHPVHIASAASIQSAHIAPDGRGLTGILQSRAPFPLGTSVAGMPPPTHVTCDGRTLQETGKLAATDEGWCYDDATGMLYVKARLRGPTARIGVICPGAEQ
jgi:hypothetical protein